MPTKQQVIKQLNEALKKADCSTLEKIIEQSHLEEFYFEEFLKYLQSTKNDDSQNVKCTVSTIAKAVERDKALGKSTLILEIGILILKHDISPEILADLVPELKWFTDEGLSTNKFYSDMVVLKKSLLHQLTNIINLIEKLGETHYHLDLALSIIRFFADLEAKYVEADDHKQFAKMATSLLEHVKSNKRKDRSALFFIMQITMGCIKQSTSKTNIGKQVLKVLESLDQAELDLPDWWDSDFEDDPCSFCAEDCSKVGELLQNEDIVIGQNLDIMKAKFQILQGNIEPQVLLDTLKILLKILQMKEDNPVKLAVTVDRLQLTKRSAIQCVCEIFDIVFSNYQQFSSKVTGIIILDFGLATLSLLVSQEAYCSTILTHWPQKLSQMDLAVCTAVQAETVKFCIQQLMVAFKMMFTKNSSFAHEASDIHSTMLKVYATAKPRQLKQVLMDTISASSALVNEMKNQVPDEGLPKELAAKIPAEKITFLVLIDLLAAKKISEDLATEAYRYLYLQQAKQKQAQAGVAGILAGVRQLIEQYKVTLPQTLMDNLTQMIQAGQREVDSDSSDSISSYDSESDD